MNEEQLVESLRLIHEQSVELLKCEVSDEVEQGLRLIISICRQQMNTSSSEDSSSTVAF